MRKLGITIGIFVLVGMVAVIVFAATFEFSETCSGQETDRSSSEGSLGEVEKTKERLSRVAAPIRVLHAAHGQVRCR